MIRMSTLDHGLFCPGNLLPFSRLLVPDVVQRRTTLILLEIPFIVIGGVIDLLLNKTRPLEGGLAPHMLMRVQQVS